jgi:deoxyribonuclease V
VDVDYRKIGAVGAGLWFRGWSTDSAVYQAVACCPTVADYEPGAFYRRELPCLLEVLARDPRPDVVVVDEYVWLGGDKPGLGAHLHAVIGGAVVGVAKTRYAPATCAIAICRGEGRSPLFVSAVGLPVEEAANHVLKMHGPYRVPTLLKQVDALARCYEQNV